jgi:hypothetical protein
VESALRQAVSTLAREYPGLDVATAPSGWSVVIPDQYRVGHEAHFAQVTEQFFGYLVEGRVPPVEVQNLLTKYAITTKAWEMSRP